MAKSEIRLGEEFRADTAYRTLFYINAVVIFFLAFLWWYLLLLVFVPIPSWILGLIALPFSLTFIFGLYWIPKYYDTLKYKLTGNEMVWRRGVWFRKTGIVPYNRITNIDIEQGPISRKLGIGSLKIQTAGYSGTSSAGKPAEIRIEGVVHFEELRALIMGYVHGTRQVGTTGTFESQQDNVLGELIKIRKLLEKRK
jgi:membrane protein YdbS with pleckstrin-like domain